MDSNESSRFKEFEPSLFDVGYMIKQDIENSDMGQELQTNRQEICKKFGEVRQTGDLDAMFALEMEAIMTDVDEALNRDTSSWNIELQSIAKAEEQIVKALKCHDLLANDKDTYKNNIMPYFKAARDGYPDDPCRDFLDSQRARMRSLLKKPYSEEEKAVFEARKANLETIDKFYKALQQKNLPEPIRGIDGIKHFQEELKQQYQAKKDTDPMVKRSQKFQGAERERKSGKGRHKDISIGVKE